MAKRGIMVASAAFTLAALMAGSGCESSEPVRIVDISFDSNHISLSEFIFQDPSGKKVPHSEMKDEAVEAELPDGGSVSWQYLVYGSPTAGSTAFGVTVDQVEPGDAIRLTGGLVQLPEGCTCHRATDAPPEVEVDVRIRTSSPSPPCHYPPCQSRTSIRRIDSEAQLGQGESATFISCETLDYADLRPYAALLFCP